MRTGAVQVKPNSNDVASTQIFLRNISRYYKDVSSVIPDGIFGRKTEKSVKEFQHYFGLPVTGVVNFDTWNKLVETNGFVTEYFAGANCVLVYPETNEDIYPGQQSDFLFVVQAMLYALSKEFANILAPQITGVHDTSSVSSVKSVQNISGLPSSGIINVDFFNALSKLYETYISRDRVENAKGNGKKTVKKTDNVRQK